MKRCPDCKKDYLDDSLLYCLDDGVGLVQGSVTDDPPTAVMSGSRGSADDLTKVLNGDRDSTRSRLPFKLVPIVAMALLLTAAIFAYAWFNDKSFSGSQAFRLSFQPPAELAFNDKVPDWVVISPDGQRIAFSATDASGKNMLYVREIASVEAKALPGSDNPLEPFWSPDSRSIAYGSNGKLKRSDLNGSNAQVLCDSARMVGGTWNSEGVIVFAPDYRTALVRVSAKGGEPTPVAMSTEDGERHRYPYFLPDGRRFLFQREQKGIWVGSLDSPEIRQIVPESAPALYSRSGHLVFIRNDALVAQPFDASTLELSGEPSPLVTDQKSWANFFRFSASDTGTLVWQGTWERDYQLVWYDRQGKQIGALEAPTKIASGMDPRISPDGRRVVIKRNPPSTIWVIDFEKSTSIRITSDFGQMPVWSPDGSRILYSGGGGLSLKAASGLGEAETLPSGPAPFPMSWSPDGRYIIFLRRGVKTRLDMFALPLDGERKEMLLLNSAFDEDGPALSPDGKWLAYASDDTGGPEIYVQSFADGKLGADRKRVSANGGRTPVWNRNGRELFFLAPDGGLMSSAVKVGTNDIEFDSPVALFMTRTLGRVGAVHEFDVSPDGQRFLIGTLIGDSKAPSPTVILNWTSLVRK